jgi:hypothetical protein
MMDFISSDSNPAAVSNFGYSRMACCHYLAIMTAGLCENRHPFSSSSNNNIKAIVWRSLEQRMKNTQPEIKSNLTEGCLPREGKQ